MKDSTTKSATSQICKTLRASLRENCSMVKQFKTKKMKKKNLLFTVIAILGFATMSFAQVPSYVPTSGLVGWWPFTGNANDLSINGNNGTVNGATLCNDRNNISNNAYQFNGSSSISAISTPSLNWGNSAYSISVWALNTSPFNSFESIATKGYSVMPYTAWILRFENTSLRWFAGTTYNSSWLNNADVTAIGNFNSNNWYHIVAVFNPANSTASLYINGVLNISISATSNVNPNNSDPLYFGASSSGENLSGNLDDIGIWNRVLTQQEITSLYTSSTVGVNEVSQSNLFSVYPNPANSQINVKADAKLLGSIYTVYDNTGKLVLTGKIISENTTIELGNLSGGIYLFSVGENLKQTFKVIKE